MTGANEQSNPSTGSVQPLAWGVMPGDNLPLWRCSSKRQAEAVVVWLREQRPTSTPQAVPLVDGRHSPTLTDAEREAISRIYDLLSERSRELQAARRIEESTPYVQLAKTLQTMWERLK